MEILWLCYYTNGCVIRAFTVTKRHKHAHATLTWSASVILRHTCGCTVRPSHHLPVRGALGAPQTLAARVIHVEKVADAAASAHAVSRRRARSEFRSFWRAGAAPCAFSSAGGMCGVVSLGARLADSVTAVSARFRRPLPGLAGAARDAMVGRFVCVVSGGAYLLGHYETLEPLKKRIVKMASSQLSKQRGGIQGTSPGKTPGSFATYECCLKE